jgi:hypothetical protein
MCGQGLELPVPVAGEGGKELLSQLHGGGLEPIAHPAAFTRLGSDQAGQVECRQVLGNSLSRDRQSGRQIRRSRRPTGGELGKDRAPTRIGECDEDLFGDRL